MNKNVNKNALNFDQYSKYQIPQEYTAYVLEFQNLNDSECENMEYDYTVQGYKIFHSEMERNNIGLFSLKLIVAKSDIVF